MSEEQEPSFEEQETAFSAAGDQVRNNMLKEIAASVFMLDYCSFDDSDHEQAHQDFQFAVWKFFDAIELNSMYWNPHKYQTEVADSACRQLQMDITALGGGPEDGGFDPELCGFGDC